MKISPGSPHQITEAQDKDGFLPLHPSFAKEDIPHFEQLKEYEGKDGTKLFSGYCDLVSDHDDIFRPNFRLAENETDYQVLVERHFFDNGEYKDVEKYLTRCLRRNVADLIDSLESSPVRNLAAFDALCEFHEWLNRPDTGHGQRVLVNSKAPSGAGAKQDVKAHAKHYAVLSRILEIIRPDAVEVIDPNEKYRKKKIEELAIGLFPQRFPTKKKAQAFYVAYHEINNENILQGLDDRDIGIIAEISGHDEYVIKYLSECR